MRDPRPSDRHVLATDVARVPRRYRIAERRPFVVDLQRSSGAEPEVEHPDLTRKCHDRYAEEDHDNPQHDIRDEPGSTHAWAD